MGEFDPFAGEDLGDSWEPPEPVLWGPLQLLAALAGVVLVLATLVGLAVVVNWVLFP